MAFISPLTTRKEQINRGVYYLKIYSLLLTLFLITVPIISRQFPESRFSVGIRVIMFDDTLLTDKRAESALNSLIPDSLSGLFRYNDDQWKRRGIHPVQDKVKYLAGLVYLGAGVFGTHGPIKGEDIDPRNCVDVIATDAQAGKLICGEVYKTTFATANQICNRMYHGKIPGMADWTQSFMPAAGVNKPKLPIWINVITENTAWFGTDYARTFLADNPGVEGNIEVDQDMAFYCVTTYNEQKK